MEKNTMRHLAELPVGSYLKPHGTTWSRLLAAPTWSDEQQRWSIRVLDRDGLQRSLVLFGHQVEAATGTPPPFTKANLARRARLARSRAGELLDRAARLDRLAEQAPS